MRNPAVSPFFKKRNIMRKWISAILAPCLIVAGLVASTPVSTANAATTWPVPIENIKASTVEVYSNGAVQVSACRSDLPNTASSVFIDSNGVERNRLEGLSSADGAGCYGTSNGLGYGAEDGTLYGMRQSVDDTSSELVAWKNNRELWTTDTTSPDSCKYGRGTSNAM